LPLIWHGRLSTHSAPDNDDVARRIDLRVQSGNWEDPVIFVLINVLIIVVVGALIFYLIDKFVRDGRLANLLKILVVLICLAAILQRLLPALGVSWF
jgi:hypothetical protein